MTTENLQPPGLKVVVNEIDTDSYKNIASIEEQNGFTIQKIEIQYRSKKLW
jgi:hypothetical protein